MTSVHSRNWIVKFHRLRVSNIPIATSRVRRMKCLRRSLLVTPQNRADSHGRVAAQDVSKIWAAQPRKRDSSAYTYSRSRRVIVEWVPEIGNHGAGMSALE